ncbi:hypothetical protein C8R43DRAFT_12920 [Mycena crocata]|nr:hypothetical protein C8R43DRAFT_12920 [Mycena crocata]
MLTGTPKCADVCAPEHATTYPRTHRLLHACAKALECRRSAHAYTSILGEIAVEREIDTPNKEPVQEELGKEPHVRLVWNLRCNGTRIWGCIAKDERDVAVVGAGICLNADMVHALESVTSPFLVDVCSLLICVTYAHEKMHAVHHALYPEYYLETTPDSYGTESDGPQGESGNGLEARLFGGNVEITWPDRVRVGFFDTIVRLTVRASSGLYIMTHEDVKAFLAAIHAGDIKPLRIADMKKAEEAMLPTVGTRGMSSAIVEAPTPGVGFGITLGPKEVSLRVGADRAPYCLPIYHGARQEDRECGTADVADEEEEGMGDVVKDDGKQR